MSRRNFQQAFPSPNPDDPKPQQHPTAKKPDESESVLTQTMNKIEKLERRLSTSVSSGYRQLQDLFENTMEMNSNETQKKISAMRQFLMILILVVGIGCAVVTLVVLLKNINITNQKISDLQNLHEPLIASARMFLDGSTKVQ